MGNVDLCTVLDETPIGTTRFSCKKFSQFIERSPLKNIAEIIYTLANEHRFLCPEISILKSTQGLKFKWVEDDYYINIIINAKCHKIDYVIGNKNGHQLYSSPWDEEKINSVFNELAKGIR
jgi:hypothetical protein